MFKKRYEEIYKGDTNWQSIKSIPDKLILGVPQAHTLSTLPFFEDRRTEVKDIVNARILALLGDSVTTDHISPAGAIKAR